MAGFGIVLRLEVRHNNDATNLYAWQIVAGGEVVDSGVAATVTACLTAATTAFESYS